MLSRREFLQSTALALAQRAGRPRGGEFVFARLRYESGDWDYNPKVAANVLDSVVQYTSIPVYRDEVVISATSDELLSFPFLFMSPSCRPNSSSARVAFPFHAVGLDR